MRRVGRYEDLDHAQGLADALEVRGIQAEVREGDGDHAVWVIDESDLETAEQVAGSFVYGGGNAHEAEARRIRKQREAEAQESGGESRIQHSRVS